MKRISAFLFALSILLAGNPVPVRAADKPVPADVDEAVYAQLLRNKWSCDTDSDGIITDDELAQTTQLSIDLADITDLTWLTRLSACRYLSFRNGTITDFSVLKELPALRNLQMDNVPVTDIRFMKELDLESCSFYEMDQITTEQRMEVMRFDAPAFWEGTSGQIEGYPRGFVDYQLSVADGSKAVFMDGKTSTIYPDEYLYGVSAGKTTYTVWIEDTAYATGEITVMETPGAYDPALQSTTVTRFETAASSYYNPDPETGSSGTVALVSDTLYTFSGSTVRVAEEDVAAYEYVYQRDYNDSYQFADMVLKTDGTLLVNGEKPLYARVRAMQKGYMLTVDGTISALVPKKNGFVTALLASDVKDWFGDGIPLYLSTKGTLQYYGYELTGDGVYRTFTENTGIGAPVSSCSIGSTCYVVDDTHTLYQLTFSNHKMTKTVVSEDTVQVMMTQDGSQIQAQHTDGTFTTVREFYSGASGYADRARKYLGVDAGTFYLPAYQTRGIEENDAVFDYFIKDGTLSLSFCGDYCGLTHVAGALCASYDTALEHGYVYFLRTDGTIWQYDLDAKQWAQSPSGTEPVPQTLAGDVNADGTFDVRDAVCLQKWLLAVPDVQIAAWQAGDLNADGTLDVFDLCLMKRRLV